MDPIIQKQDRGPQPHRAWLEVGGLAAALGRSSRHLEHSLPCPVPLPRAQLRTGQVWGASAHPTGLELVSRNQHILSPRSQPLHVQASVLLLATWVCCARSVLLIHVSGKGFSRCLTPGSPFVGRQMRWKG